MNKLTLHLLKKISGINIEQLQNDNEQLLIKNAQLSTDIKQATQEASYKRAQLSEIQTELLNTQSEVSLLQTEKDEAIHKLSQQEQDIASLQNQLSEKKQEMEELQQKLALKEIQLAELETTAEHWKTEANQAIQTSNASEKQINDIQVALQETNTEKEDLQQALAQLHTQLQQLTAANNELTLQNSALEANNEQLNQSITAFQQEIDSLKEKLNEANQPITNNATSSIPQTSQAANAPETDDEAEETTEQDEKEDTAKAYIDMKKKLEASTLKYPYTRLTIASNGSQYIFLSKTLQLKAELFIWGVEGKEVILDKLHFIPYNEIAKIEGLDTPFIGDVMNCDYSENGNAIEVAELLLSAIIRFQPIHITYRDKNGRISERNLYWISFLPTGKQDTNLPNAHLFHDMFNDNIDSDHIIAMCTHVQDPRVFTINQIQTIQVFNAFVTDNTGIDTLFQGIYLSLLNGQTDTAEIICQSLPEKFRQQPKAVSLQAHYFTMLGENQKAIELYLSIEPDSIAWENQTWQQINETDFKSFIQNDVCAERFTDVQKALTEAGWHFTHTQKN